MFGDWGILLQLLITAVVVIGLAGIVWWAARRYTSAGLGRIGRGRVPRLAIIDAMSVDGRRRLVLVRRDNVEHLILIGGPSDLVVEQSIQRPRRPKSAAEGESAAPDEAPPPPAVTIAREPVRPAPAAAQANGAQPQHAATGERAFSFRRATPVPPPPAPPAEEPANAGSPARLIDFQRPTRIEAAPPPALPVEESEPLFPDLPAAEMPPGEPPPSYGGNGAAHAGPTEPRSGEAGPAPNPFAKPEAQGGDNSNKLADLENEMARLLGEITQKRHS